jgi:PleD family two-component response regulator
MTFSCGLAAADGSNGFSADRILQRADEALYDAKRNGRDRIELAGT